MSSMWSAKLHYIKLFEIDIIYKKSYCGIILFLLVIIFNSFFICSGDHVEVITIDFDPNEISFLQLLDLFWNNHEYGLGTRVKRQYQSIIFYQNDKQKCIACESLQYEKINRSTTPITTQIIPADIIYVAEE